MSANPLPRSSTEQQNDRLLWLAGAVLVAMGVTWLVISRPWSSDATPAPAVAPAVSLTSTTPPPVADAPAPAGSEPTLELEPALSSDLSNPLRMAQLAYDAGMLVEPDEYSAWTLFARVLKSEPGNAAALEGLTKVADDLVRRGETALDQGRFDDTRATVERIRTVLPNHPGAKALAQKIFPVTDVRPTTPPLPTPEAERVAKVETAPAPPPKPAVDPVVEASQAFEKALAEGRLLTPAEQSAKHYVGVLNRLNVDHALSKNARSALSAEFLSRAAQSIEALDPQAAGIWIDEAEALLGATDEGVRKARSALTEQLIAMESAKPIPASALKISTYVAPEFPQRASERNITGWVDVEFTVQPDGSVANVRATAGQPSGTFDNAAVDAVRRWRFRPVERDGEVVAQRARLRIRFAVE